MSGVIAFCFLASSKYSRSALAVIAEGDLGFFLGGASLGSGTGAFSVIVLGFFLAVLGLGFSSKPTATPVRFLPILITAGADGGGGGGGLFVGILNLGTVGMPIGSGCGWFFLFLLGGLKTLGFFIGLVFFTLVVVATPPAPPSGGGCGAPASGTFVNMVSEPDAVDLEPNA